MFSANSNSSVVKNTTHKVVLPFYLYAALSFLVATVLLSFSTGAFTQHFFHPQILAITHVMALGWGTMIILGASHQLVPVLIEGKLYSVALAYASFVLAATGIPLLVYGFYFFDVGWPAQCGGILVNLAIVSYLVNLGYSMAKSKSENVHSVFIFMAALWLLLTTLVGLLLLYNFTGTILPNDSVHYLPLHAHMGIVGWFLLLVIGVGSRLVPLFLISKYSNDKLLWVIFILINGGMLTFIISFLYFPKNYYLLPVIAILFAIGLFGYYCYQCYKQRIRKRVDEQMKISLLSVSMMLLPMTILFIIIGLQVFGNAKVNLVIVYGFVVFFGWITAIIFGMTFKTLPFIVWNKVYHLQAGLGQTPNPKDLFNSKIFLAMSLGYFVGFILFIFGIYLKNILMLNFASIFLIMAALLYNWNVIKLLIHQPAR